MDNSLQTFLSQRHSIYDRFLCVLLTSQRSRYYLRHNSHGIIYVTVFTSRYLRHNVTVLFTSRYLRHDIYVRNYYFRQPYVRIREARAWIGTKCISLSTTFSDYVFRLTDICKTKYEGKHVDGNMVTENKHFLSLSRNTVQEMSRKYGDVSSKRRLVFCCFKRK